jgi:hypothetical protein
MDLREIGWGTMDWRGVKLLTSVDISTRAPWITLNEQHMACTSTMPIVLGCKIPHDALKWKAIGRRRVWTGLIWLSVEPSDGLL